MPQEKIKRNVVVLFRLISIISVVSGLIVIGLAAVGIHNIFSRHVIGVAEKEAILIGELLTKEQREVFLIDKSATPSRLEIAPFYHEWFDQHIRELLEPFEILKIKIFSPDGRIIYSTDSSILGELDAANPRLQRALNGEADSHLENKNSMRDLRNESTFDVDVVETYTPIVIDGATVGVFELYIDVTQFRHDIFDGTLKSSLLLVLILAVVFLVAFIIAHSSMKHLAAAEGRLHAQATLDALTGVLNRGELMSRAQAEYSRNSRLSTEGSLPNELCLVMLDIDHFKLINDVYGHLAGDAVLRQLAERIKQRLRMHDLLGRYGGEEFLLLLPHTKLDDAARVAERVRGTIEETPFLFNRTKLQVTISLGVATHSEGLSLSQIIAQADQALYQAKQRGRNRVEIHTLAAAQLDKAL